METANAPAGATSPTTASVPPTFARPWPRYWARSLDLLLFSVLADAGLRIFAPTLFGQNSSFLGPDRELKIGIILLPLALLIDAFAYGIFGNTPGKWLSGIRISDISGKAISFASYLRRNFIMYAAGLGLGIGIIALGTLIYSHNKAKRGELLPWDRGRESRSLQVRPGTWRSFAAGTTYVLLTALLMTLAIAGHMQPTPREDVAAAVTAANKNAPRMVNSVIRFDGAQQGAGLAMQYNYSVLDVSASATDPATVKAYYQGKVRPKLVKFVCTSPDMKGLRKIGATVRYSYADRSGASLSTISIPTSDCH